MTAGLVLAAGRGTRFGGGKMLASIAGRPMLQHVLDLAADAGLGPVVVVLGDDPQLIERAVTWRDEVRVRNEDPDRGLSSSLVVGLESLAGLDPDASRVLVMLGDQPFVTLAQLEPLLATPEDAERPIIVPRYEGNPGNPVLLEREAWPLAAKLEGDRGMSQLFAGQPALVRYVAVPGANPDIDTALDLARLSRGAG